MQRRRRANWLKYDQAARIAKEAGCVSRKSFWDWHAAARPNNIPKMPQRVYKEWTTWGEFLGTNNTFQIYEKGSYRQYWEAVRWAQKTCKEHKLTRSLDWLHYYDANEESIPNDIPKNAHYHYKEDWLGWATWLGSNIEATIVSQQQEIAVFALCTQSWSSANVIRVVVANDGIEELKEKMEADNLTPVRVYQFEKDNAQQASDIINACGSVQGDGSYIVRDMNNLLFEYDNLLLKVDV